MSSQTESQRMITATVAFGIVAVASLFFMGNLETSSGLPVMLVYFTAAGALWQLLAKHNGVGILLKILIVSNEPD